MRIKIIANQDPGVVVNLVNKALRGGWQILSEHVIGVHAYDNLHMTHTVPLYVVYLTQTEEQTQ
jgi:hypothetical protein